MDLVINTYGTKIGCTGERITLSFPNVKKKKEYPIRRIDRLLISGPASVTTHAIRLAMEYEVDLVCLGEFGKPVGRFISSKPHGLSKLRRSQLEFVNSTQSIVLAKEIVGSKSNNQIVYLDHLQKRFKIDCSQEISQACDMFSRIENIPNDLESKDGLLGVEGYIAERYFTSLRKFFDFPGRKPHKRDPFNSSLNYGYGMLYNEVERACLYVGLDPYLGVLHSERYGKPSLVLDMVEEFRVAVVDAAIMPLFIKNKVDVEKHFDKILEEDYKLSEKGKAVVIQAVYKRLEQQAIWRGKSYTLKAIIENQVRALGRYFLGKEKHYQSFSINDMHLDYE